MVQRGKQKVTKVVSLCEGIAENMEVYPFNLCKIPGPEVIKLFSCSTQLSMKLSLLINMKMPTNVGIFIFISGENFILR